jgi:hypothetical protein
LPVSQKELALRNRDGDGIPKDTNKFKKIIKELAESGDGEAAYILANYYLLAGFIGNIQAQPWMSKAADLGWVPAQIDRSMYLINAIKDKSDNIEVPIEDQNKILNYLANALQAGNSKALLAYGMLHENGILFVKDDLKATSFYKKALASGERSANWYLWGVDLFGYFQRDYYPDPSKHQRGPFRYMDCRIKLSSRSANDDRVDRNFEAKEPLSEGMMRINGNWWSVVKDGDYSLYRVTGRAPNFFDPNTDPVPHIIDFDNGIFIERVRRADGSTFSIKGNHFLSHACESF